jgi:NAD(P)-dependent dehydrogenase (short-subunit alcohol dehydrogenase family)
MSPTLANHRILITGGGSGIGAATSRLAAGRGATVAVLDRDAEAAKAVAEQIRHNGGDALAVQADVSDEASMEAAFKEAITGMGGLTGIANNAGMIVTKPLHETSVEEWDLSMAVNARGVFLGCRFAVDHFLANGGGSIVNTASISALVGLAGQPAYCASKGAVLQLTRQIAVDYSNQGIRCNSVGPGSVTTPVLEAYLSGQPDPSRARSEIVAAHPIGRLAAPEEIAAAICFLLSDDASFITGANLQADGGYTAA